MTDVADGCFRSSANYPALVAEKLGAQVEDRSCGGATIADFRTSQYPGVRPQLSAVTAKTDLVTLGIGGNDEGVFRTLVGGCFSPGAPGDGAKPADCRVTLDGAARNKLVASLARTQKGLTGLLEEIRAKAPQAQVLVVGYPQIISGKRCDRLPLAAADYAYAAQVNRVLNRSVQAAARASGATYIDVAKASQGHDICSADPWVNGSVSDQKRAAAYHPFAAEQQAVADLVLAAAKG